MRDDEQVMRSTMESRQRLVVLGTGGTIAGRAATAGDTVGYRAGEVGVADLLEGVPRPDGLAVETQQVAQVDSKDMGPAVWRALLAAVQASLQRPEVRGVVVTHGTDTLEETAFLLQRVLRPSKPVVMVSAMRPTTALVPDGPQNLADALAIAALPGAEGVVAVCAGEVHSALDVRKAHNHRLNAFDSGEAGTLGVLEAGRWRAWRSWPGADESDARSLPWNDQWLEQLVQASHWPRVDWVTSHGGADGALVRALLAQRQLGLAAHRQAGPPASHHRPDPPVLQGLVVSGTGNGTIHRDLLDALEETVAAGVTVWRSTRCAQGMVIAGGRCENPDIPATPWPPAKARLELMLQLLG